MGVSKACGKHPYYYSVQNSSTGALANSLPAARRTGAQHGKMPAVDESSSEHKHSSRSSREDVEKYKTLCEQLEAELADFQNSSRELEQELEKDIEASEKRERQLKEKVDNLRYEVDEWKVWCRQSAANRNQEAHQREDQMQAVQNRIQHRAQQPSEGDHFSSRHEPHFDFEAARHRGCER